MAGVIQRGVYPCRFGTVVGRELSGRRNALVLSSVDLHTVSLVAIAAPTSGQEPPKHEHLTNQTQGILNIIRMVIANAGSVTVGSAGIAT